MVKTRQKVFRKKSRKGMKGGVKAPRTKKRNPHPFLMKFPFPSTINIAKSAKDAKDAKYSLPQSATSATSAQDDRFKSYFFVDEIRRKRGTIRPNRVRGPRDSIKHKYSQGMPLISPEENAKIFQDKKALHYAAKLKATELLEPYRPSLASSLEKMKLGP